MSIIVEIYKFLMLDARSLVNLVGVATIQPKNIGKTVVYGK